MTAHLTLPAVTAALVRAGVQTVVSWDEEPTMECPSRRHEWVDPPCDRGCGGSGRVPLSGDVEIRAGDYGDPPPNALALVRALGAHLEDKYGLDAIRADPNSFMPTNTPVARATVQCVPVVEWRNRSTQSTTYLTLDPASRLRVRVIDRGLSIGWWEDFTPQLPFLDLDAPWALILSDVRPVEDR